MTTNIHDYVIERLLAAKYRWPQVASGSGVPRSTLVKIAKREIKDPGVSHVQKLYDYFQSQEKPAQ